LFERTGALRGNVVARHNIGCFECYDLGSREIGNRHWKVAAEAGCQRFLNAVRRIYNADGKLPGKQFVSKEHLGVA